MLSSNKTVLQPSYTELLFILILGALQPLIDMFGPAVWAVYYNVLAVVLVVTYMVYRYGSMMRKVALWQAWGFRLDTLRSAVMPYGVFTMVVALLFLAYGYWVHDMVLPRSWWYLVAVYPVWGIAQQFALQNLVVRHVTGFLSRQLVVAGVAAVLFSLAHAPDVKLMLLTLAGGFCFTLLYQKYPNLWLLGMSHGIVGALAFYLVLGQDQWEILRAYF